MVNSNKILNKGSKMIFDNISDLKEKTKINIYGVLYKHKSKENNFSIGLPENINRILKKDYVDQIKAINNYKIKAFDPSNSGLYEGTCEKVKYLNLKPQVDYIFQLLEKHGNYKKENVTKIRQTNAYICEMKYNDKMLYIFSCQDNTTEKIFTNKHILMAQEDDVKIIENKKVFMYSSHIDFIIEKNDDKGQVLIFNKHNFIKFFNYDEEIKKFVIENIKIIDEWKFLNSADFIKEKVINKKVYQNLYKVFRDEDYMEQIKKVTPKQLKKNLLENSSGEFSNDDFDNDKLLITKANINVVIKMISKGFRYNFFTNKAEEDV